MQRREALKLLAINSIYPAIPSEVFVAFQQVHRSLPDKSTLKVLDEHQNATVIALAEWIIPETETPGATSVRVNEFIDRILSDWYSEEERSRFLNGLENVDTRAQLLCGKDFIEGSTEEQIEVVHALGTELAQLVAHARASAPAGSHRTSPQLRGNFYFMFRNLTLTGYFTSQAGFVRQLHEELIPGRYDGCTAATPAEPLIPLRPPRTR